VDVDTTSGIVSLGTIRPLDFEDSTGTAMPLYTEVGDELVQIMEAF
jgi:hypothetical protein